MNHADAQEACLSEGGHLIYMETVDERECLIFPCFHKLLFVLNRECSLIFDCPKHYWNTSSK